MTTKSRVRTVLGAQFDDYAVRDRVRVGERHTVYDVTVEGRRAACKLTGCQPAVLAREGSVLRAVADQTAVPAPAVFDAGEGYLLLEWVAGESDDGTGSPDRRLDRLRAVGRTLAGLHSATEGWFDGHGPLERGDGPLTVDGGTGWPDRFGEFVTAWADDLAGTRNAPAGTAVVAFADDHRALLADRPPVLVHGEASPDHVLFDGRGVSALLDWELAQAAPGEFDLVWTERDLLGRPTDSDADLDDRRTALLDGYERERPLGPGFPARRELYRAAFAMRELSVENDATFAERPAEEYRTALRTFVDDRLVAAREKAAAAGY